jgi:hypothetical protein
MQRKLSHKNESHEFTSFQTPLKMLRFFRSLF